MVGVDTLPVSAVLPVFATRSVPTVVTWEPPLLYVRVTARSVSENVCVWLFSPCE